MKIPSGYWIVVQQECRKFDRGTIIKSGLTEAQAKYYAELLKSNLNSNYNIWAMHRDQY